MTEGENEFVKQIAGARVTPLGADAEYTLPTAFPMSESSPGPLGKLKPEDLAIPIECDFFSKVFVVWRPWMACTRCSVASNTGEVQLPPDGEYVCPHTQEKEYIETLDTITKGKGILRYEERFNIVDGTRCIHVGWFKYTPDYLDKIKKQLQAKSGLDNATIEKTKGKEGV